jgi:hypothetical protein
MSGSFRDRQFLTTEVQTAMRTVVGLILAINLLSATAEAAPKLLWEAKGLAQPESAVVDPATGAIYVSNINGAIMQKDGNGFIAKLNGDGKIVTRDWVKGLDAPTGLALHDRTLYAVDIDQLVEINAASGAIVKRYPAKSALFLNDVVAGPDGVVYASDTPTNTIWRLKDGSFEPWLANDNLDNPNGLLVQGDKNARDQMLIEARESAFGGAVVSAFAAVFYVVAAFVPRKPWGWILGLIAIIGSIFPFCITAAGAVPLLIHWLKPETKRYFSYRK